MVSSLVKVVDPTEVVFDGTDPTIVTEVPSSPLSPLFPGTP
jgi:hypothetical protein